MSKSARYDVKWEFKEFKHFRKLRFYKPDGKSTENSSREEKPSLMFVSSFVWSRVTLRHWVNRRKQKSSKKEAKQHTIQVRTEKYKSMNTTWKLAYLDHPIRSIQQWLFSQCYAVLRTTTEKSGFEMLTFSTVFPPSSLVWSPNSLRIHFHDN